MDLCVIVITIAIILIFCVIAIIGEVDVKCDMGSSKKCLHACLPRRVAVERGLVTFDPPNVVQSTHKRNRKRKHKTNSSSTSEFTNTDENSSTTG